MFLFFYCVGCLFIALGNLAKEFVRIKKPNVIHNFRRIVFDYIKSHRLGDEEFSNISGLLFYFKSNGTHTFGELADAAAKVSKMYPDMVARIIR